MRLTPKHRMLIFLLAALALAGCESLPAPFTFLKPPATLDPAALTGTMSAAQTLTALPTNTPTITPSRTPSPTSTITRTPVGTATLAPLITIAVQTNLPTLTKLPSLTPIPKPRPTSVPVCDGGSYVADVTVPDGTTFTPGERFIKTWRVKNNGTCTWTTAYSIVFSSGNQFGAPASLPMPASVAPGQTVDISIPMTAPAAVGSYKSNWMFKNAAGGTFGVGATSKYTTPIWADIKVAGSAQSVAYDFTQNACTAAWSSGWGNLPCPGVNGDARGFVLQQNAPKMETGANDTLPGLVTFPQSITNGYIKGVYPAYTVKSGDIFQTNLDCEYNNAACNVTFTLGYISSGTYNTLQQKVELYDGKVSSISQDLSGLVGQSVQFVLQVDANGAATQARAQWLHPIILGAPAPPTVTPTATITPTATPVPVVLLDFNASLCVGSWLSAAGTLPCPGTNGAATGYALPLASAKLDDGVVYNSPSVLLAPQNAPGGFIAGFFTTAITIQAGDRFVAKAGCEFGNNACSVIFSLQYDDGSGTYNTLGIQPKQYDGVIADINFDLSSLAGKTVKFILVVETILPSAQNRLILVGPRIIR